MGKISLFILIGYLYGLRTGLTTAVAYGFLQLVVDPYIISIPQMLTDYIFAFGALGLSGIFAGKKDGTECRPSARQMMCAALNDAAFDWGEAERLANLRDFQVLSQLRALREELSHA